jgi:hypothetical protein
MSAILHWAFDHLALLAGAAAALFVAALVAGIAGRRTVALMLLGGAILLSLASCFAASIP